MSEQQAEKCKHAGYAFWAWAIALATLMGVLALVLLRAPSLSGNMTEAEAQEVKKLALRAESGVYDAGYVLADLPKPDSIDVPSPGFTAENKYVLVGYGLQGLYQSSPVGLPWQIDEEEKLLEAQVILRGRMPKVVTEDIRVSWALNKASNLENGTVMFATDEGEMERHDNIHSYRASIDSGVHMKEAELFNPYQVLTLKAVKESTGETVAESAAVLAMSPGFGCAHCHADPAYGILALHDKMNGTSLKADASSDSPISCKSCHNGAMFEDGEYQAGMLISFSSAIHGWHAQFLKDREGDACLTCHVGLGRAQEEEEDSPASPLFMRDIHQMRGLACVKCHGYMEDHALALLQAEQKAGQELATSNMKHITPRAVEKAEDINPRLPWLQEPDCTTCHDFAAKPVVTEVSGFNAWTDIPDSEGGLELFSKRLDYSGVMRCTSCHGAPHATYPAENAVASGRDNIVPMQYQHQALVMGAGGNCAVCHMQSRPTTMPVHHPIVERTSTAIHVPKGADLMMPKVRFSHEAHTPLLECSTCHHTGHKDGTPLLCVNAGCHDLTNPDEPEDGEEYRYFQQAFHGELPSCLACHTERREKWLPSGPTDCEGCHRAPSDLWD